MVQFQPAVEKTLGFENGFTHVLETGEVVNFGITHWFLRSVGLLPLQSSAEATPAEIDFVRNLTKPFAEQLYLEYFWNAYKCGELLDQALANKFFDLSVNMGPSPAARAFQDAINRLIWPSAIKVDAAVGPKTIAAANSCDPVELLAQLRKAAEAHYRWIAKNNPKLTRNLDAWLRRLAS